jgi:hypothetical protein
MRQIRPDHEYLIEWAKEEGRPHPDAHEIFQPDDADWPLYNVSVKLVSAEESFYGKAGFALGMSIKHKMTGYWTPVDYWNPMPLEMGKVLIFQLEQTVLI